MPEHRVEVLTHTRDGKHLRRAWCSTCYWSGPLVKLRSAADRHAERHAARSHGTAASTDRSAT